MSARFGRVALEHESHPTLSIHFLLFTIPDLLVALTSQDLTSIMQVEYEDTMSMPPPPNGMQVLSHQGFEASDDEEEEEEVQDGGGEFASLSSRPVRGPQHQSLSPLETM